MTTLVEQTADQILDEADSNKKQLILAALFKHGTAPDVISIVIWAHGHDHGLRVNNTTRALWELQKQEMVTFKEARDGLYKIRLTEKAAALFRRKEPKAREPIVQVKAPTPQPKVVPSVPYTVPEPPRYASPPPPAQNTKSFIDENAAEVQHAEYLRNTSGKDAVVDTHTEYRGDESYNVYPDKKGRSGAISMRVAGRLLMGLDQIGGTGTRIDAAKAVGISTNSRPTVIGKALEHWGWIRRVDDKIAITPDGYMALENYRKEIGVDTPPMPVVARDVPEKSFEELEAEDAAHERIAGPNLDNYPLIKDLMGKEGRLAKYQQAAEILNDDSEMTDIVLALLEKIQLTDLEREVIRFVRTVL